MVAVIVDFLVALLLMVLLLLELLAATWSMVTSGAISAVLHAVVALPAQRYVGKQALAV